SDPGSPRKVGFLPAEPNSYVGEGIHVIDYGQRDLLVHNNETCDADRPVVSGFSLWDVTDPRSPVKLGQFGDTTPSVANQTFHTTHSVQAFAWRDRAYAVAQDNQDLKDVDIFDLTPVLRGEGPAALVAERGIEDWPGAQTTYANGDTVFHHDMQQQVIDGHNMLAVSYWDAGQVLLNIDDPANPVFVGDSDYLSPDPEFPSFGQAEGNSHQSYWDQDGDWLISTDEDFSPTRTLFEITEGQHAGQYGGGEFSWAKPIPEAGITSSGGTVFGGSGCPSDQNGNGTPDRGEVPSSASTGADTVVFSRGACFFSDKVRSGEDAGYRVVLIGQSHGGTRNGMLRDGFICGSQGSPTLGTAHAVCIGHRAMHLLFDDAPAYSPPEGYAAGGDLPAIGTRGANISARPSFDGWGYVNLHDARSSDLPIVDTYAVAESKDPAYRSGFGDLTVHEVKTDPRRGKDLAYLSYYNAGLRVAAFGPAGLQEVGHFIAEGGNDFWGVVPVCAGKCARNDRDKGRSRDDAKRPLLLMSDRDSGLWILRYTGKE
ncbi:MAG TPA: hypothetical protein VNT32_08635, partial [Thermoleophilaceae bacterium]|nr:hypothetical protein [Thermoleophilaceae bacterium]